MNRRLFTPEPLPPGGGPVTIDGPEAHHLLHVLRGRVGTPVDLFDGRGSEASGTVTACKRQSATVEVGPARHRPRMPARAVTIGCPVPKGDARQRFLIEKLTELGVANYVPLRTDRDAPSAERDRSERLIRGTIEACKQCRRNVLLTIAASEAWPDFVARSHHGRRFVAHPGPAAGFVPTASGGSEGAVGERLGGEGPLTWGIGPEGGFTDAEVALAVAAGWRTVALGPRILRMETACEVAAAWSLLGESGVDRDVAPPADADTAARRGGDSDPSLSEFRK